MYPRFLEKRVLAWRRKMHKRFCDWCDMEIDGYDGDHHVTITYIEHMNEVFEYPYNDFNRLSPYNDKEIICYTCWKRLGKFQERWKKRQKKKRGK